MKTSLRLTSCFSALKSLLPLVVGVAALLNATAQTTYYWDGNGATAGAGSNAQVTGTWGASAFWTTTKSGTTATALSVLTFSDTAVFTAWDGVPANNPTGAYTVTLNAAQSVAGIVIGDSTGAAADGTLTLAGIGSPGLTIGAGGVTLNGSNGDPKFDVTLGTVTLAADQTWTVNNAHVVAVSANVAGNATAGNTRIWTLGYLNAFTNTFTGTLTNGGGGGELAVTVNNFNGASTGAGTQSISGTANSYTGKTTITQGALQITSLKNVGGGASSLGAVTTVAKGTIDIGSGTSAGSLVYNGATASSSDRVINLSGSTGGATISSINAASAGALTLTSDITAATGNKTLTLRGSNLGANTIAGKITDPDVSTKIALVKADAGLWVLSGSNTFTGGTTISNGILSLTPAGTLGGNVVGNNIVISGGNLLLSAATNYGANQTVTVNSGGIGVGYTPASLPTITDNTGATGGVYGINYTGDGAVTSLATLYNGNWFLGSFTTGTYTGASLGAGNGNTYRLGGGGGSLTVQNSVLTGSANLIVGGAGGGNVILASGNTFTGKTTIQSGTLTVSSLNKVIGGTGSSSLGAPTTALNGTIDLGSGANAVGIAYTGTGETTDRVINFAGTTGGVTFTNAGSGNLNFTSTATFTGVGNKALVFGAATDSFGGSIGPILNSSGTISITKNGLTNSTWTLTGSNTFTGQTTINGGVIAAADLLATSARVTLAGNTGSLAILQGTGTITRQLSTGASRLDWAANSGFAAQGGKLTLNLTNSGTVAGGQLTWGAGGFMGTGVTPLVFGSSTADSQVELMNNFDLGTSVSSGFNRVIQVEAGTGTDSAKISGTISLGGGTSANNGIVKAGKGKLILSALNTYSGQTIIRDGTIIVENNSLVGVAGALGSGTGAVGSNAVQLGDGTTGAASNPSLLIGGAYTIARPITVNDNGTGNTYSIGGITDNIATFSGAIGVANGSANNNVFKVTQVATTGSNALNITGGITGGASVNTKTVNFDNVGAVNLTTVGIADGAGGGKVAVTKTNTGRLTITAVNTYTGTTTVAGGTLLVSGTGNINSSAAVSITGGTLDYQNNVTGLNRNVTLNGGTFKNNSTQNYTGVLTFTSGTVAGTNLAGVALSIGAGKTLSPGNSPGTLTTGAETWATGGNYNWQILDATGAAGTGFDTIALTTGSVLDITATSSGKFNINLWSLSSIGPDVNGNALNFNNGLTQSWTLVSTDQTITGFSADAFQVNTAAFNGTAGFSNTLAGAFTVALGDSNTDLILTYTAVPEPTTGALVALGLTGLALLRRRRSA